MNMKVNSIITTTLALVQAIFLGIYINVATDYFLKYKGILLSIIKLDSWNLLIILSIILLYFQIHLSLKVDKRTEELKKKLINEILKNAAKSLIYPHSKRHIRAIITMVNKKKNKRETKYAYNILIDPEKYASYDLYFGVAGEAFKKKIPVASQLASNHIDSYDENHKNIVSPALRSILAVPIFSTKEKNNVIGILAFDSFDDIKLTKFDTDESKQLAQSWANVISELLS